MLTLTELRREEGRGGKRKPIQEEEEEDVKKEEHIEHKQLDFEAKDDHEVVKVHQEVVIRAPQT